MSECNICQGTGEIKAHRIGTHEEITAPCPMERCKREREEKTEGEENG